MELTVYKINGETTGRKVDLDESIFGIEPNDHAIYLDTKLYLANQRQGTHAARERSQVSGSTRKLKRQKGTGGARSGDINSPVFVGGGRVFGPRPRTYGFKLNKKVKQLARKSALSYKAVQEKITVIEDFSFDKPRTKGYIEMLTKLNVFDKKTLLVVSESNNNVYLSARNLGQAKVSSVLSLNTYEILNAQNILFVESALPVVNQILSAE
ncbi:MAG TPA: 50S ribosomal protein L4 [Bacteroidales bacterium]|nr:MAG: 50S ribosomal protein L4 [Bacteroidetes bacterium GWE2_42_24]OFY29263.1 MAG: 50S ribosomal protein L4 [Bacteroidetes bacterium GWF2_43_11]PKP23343.1 MAG: 50S ribosomal protein L4 [Bacteroidetes bacterium HGW-Bacteroidetes-22]HBZ66746.1 50S ribosomal protein L4 [Bacteroidales bacterium]